MSEAPTTFDRYIPADNSAEVESSFLLTAIDVFNWGPFHGRHHCVIDPCGTAIIGPTGSGKTTLVDALMTLIAPYPKYNLASTGGHESDRDLISYVRGVSGVESAQAENSHVARPSKTLTGLAATLIRTIREPWPVSKSGQASEGKHHAIWEFELAPRHADDRPGGP